MPKEFQRRIDALGQFRVADCALPQLTKDDEHHLRSVLRARVGEEIVVTNGAGSWAICEVGEKNISRVTDVEVDPAVTRTTLFMAPLKADRSEWAIAKATELGISEVVPLVTERISVKFKGENRDKILRRWRRIAEEAAGQCRRTYDIVIGEPIAMSELPTNVAVCDFGGSSDWSAVTAVAIGPEGGFAPHEISEARQRLSLGNSVLRGETAAISAATVIAFSTGGWGFTSAASAHE
jgi:16S rRNA (uracil1498-N3)-methyltransferase